jgi:hypothetical protein
MEIIGIDLGLKFIPNEGLTGFRSTYKILSIWREGALNHLFAAFGSEEPLSDLVA